MQTTQPKKNVCAAALAGALWLVGCSGGSIDGPSDAGADGGARGADVINGGDGDSENTIAMLADRGGGDGDGDELGGDGDRGEVLDDGGLPDSGADAIGCTSADDCPATGPACFVARPFYTDCCTAAGVCGCQYNAGVCE